MLHVHAFIQIIALMFGMHFVYSTGCGSRFVLSPSIVYSGDLSHSSHDLVLRLPQGHGDFMAVFDFHENVIVKTMTAALSGASVALPVIMIAKRDEGGAKYEPVLRSSGKYVCPHA